MAEVQRQISNGTAYWLPMQKITQMSSLEIAQITRKAHKDVMRAIRTMEPAWIKINGRKFALVDYIDAKGEKRPCYELTKLEFLYIITKFNDEARAKLVLRWIDLEEEQQRAMMRAVEEERKALNNRLDEQQHIVQYYRDVLTSEDTCTVRQIAHTLKMTAQELNKLLCRERIQYGQSGSYIPYADYARRGFCKSRTYLVQNEDGSIGTVNRTTWTERGKEFVVNLVNELRKKSEPKVKVVQLTLEFDE